MSPSPAHDPRLPRLWDAFDGETMVELLGDRLPMLRCRPCYVRYKPTTSCLIQYDVALRLPAGDVIETTVHVTMYADDRGRNRASNNRMRRLLDRAARHAPELAGRHAAYLPELSGLAQVFPIDYDLRPLVRVADPASMRKVFSRSLPSDAGGPSEERPRLMRYKPGRKALFLFQMEHGTVDPMYVKLFEDDRAERIFRTTATLRDAGIVTPQALMCSSRLRLIAHERASGIQLASLRGTPRFEEWMEPVAVSLARLQAVDIRSLPVRTMADEAATIVRTVHWLGLLLPALAPRLTRLGERIANRLTDQADDLRTVHGDFYDDQALVSDSGVALIDLDELHRGHPLTDVGNMLAHLRSGETRGDGTGSARDRFLRAALGDSSHTTGDVASFEAAALLKLAPGPFRRLEPDWPNAIERIIGLAEACLKQGGRSFRGVAGAGLEAIEDPKLPQLRALRDRQRMTSELSGFGKLRDIELIRHKPGRRAILRYTVLARDGVTEHLYGKTFASERGPRVFGIAQTIANARAFGAGVSVPEPIAFLPHLKLLVQRSVPGQPVESDLLVGDRELATRIATAFHRLHACGIDLGRRHDLSAELAPLARRVDDIRAIDPALFLTASRCLTAIATMARAKETDSSWRWRPIHRDAYHDQVLIDDGRLAILDLDDAAMSEPAVDIANIAAHLQLLGIQRHGNSTALVGVIEAFLRQSLHLDPGLDPTLLDVLRAATLLRLAGVHISRHDGIRVATLLLGECVRTLSAAQAMEITGTTNNALATVWPQGRA